MELFLEWSLVIVLIAGLMYFLLDSTALFEWIERWLAAILVLLGIGFVLGIGIHLANITFGW